MERAHPAERLRAAVEQAKETDLPQVTISIGVSVRLHGNELDPDHLVEEADQALYRAKQSGRNRVEAALRRRRASGGKALVPYLTGGLGEWVPTIEAVAQAGADAIEVGIPFSDPVMDGPTIQAASDRALRDGALPIEVIEAAGSADVGIPLAVMTYYNLVFRPGVTRFAGELAQAGIAEV